MQKASWMEWAGVLGAVGLAWAGLMVPRERWRELAGQASEALDWRYGLHRAPPPPGAGGPPGQGREGPPTFINTETHWWDGSQLYGSHADRQAEVRAGENGKLKIGSDGLLL